MVAQLYSFHIICRRLPDYVHASFYLKKVDNHYILRCAIGLIEPGQRITLNWQLTDGSNALKYERKTLFACAEYSSNP